MCSHPFLKLPTDIPSHFSSHQTNLSNSLITSPHLRHTQPQTPIKHYHHPTATMGILQTAMIAASGIYAVKSLEKTVIRTQRSQNRNDSSYSSSSASNQNNHRPRFDDQGPPPNYYHDQNQNQNYGQGVTYNRGPWGPSDGMGSGQGPVWQPVGQYDTSRGGNGVEYGDGYNQRRGFEGCDLSRRDKKSGN